MKNVPQVNKTYILVAMSLEFAPVEDLLKGTELDLEDIYARESIDADMAVKLVNNLLEFSYTPNVAAIYGRHLGVASHGPAGYATLSAPTLGIALSTFMEWFQVRCETYSGRVVETNDHFEIHIDDTTGSERFQTFFFECFMRAFEVLITQIRGYPANGETHLFFKTGAENRKDLMLEEYDSELHFNQEINKLSVSKNVWFQPSPLYDKASYEYNLRQCRQLLEANQHRSRLDIQVRHIISQHFENAVIGQASGQFPPQLSELCASFHTSERTLIRKLKEYNTSYKHLLEEERLKYAQRLLKEARYTIFDIAEILGYQEPANFCRAFKRWTKQSPTEYRRAPLSNTLASKPPR